MNVLILILQTQVGMMPFSGMFAQYDTNSAFKNPGFDKQYFAAKENKPAESASLNV
jgi:hypothetical protein